MKKILSLPTFYDFFQNMVGATKIRKILLNDYLSVKPGARIMDIGCGTAEILDLLPDVDYYGFDMSQEYIDCARRKYGDRGHFECIRVSEQVLENLEGFDFALALGILHHCSDSEAEYLMKLGYKALKPGGTLLTFDGCMVDGQSRIARYILKNDRGEYVRNEAEYRKIANMVFDSVKTDVRSDTLNIPYSHMIMLCVKD